MLESEVHAPAKPCQAPSQVYAGIPGPISAKTRFQDLAEPLPLELGGILPRVRVAYRTWGRLAPDGANAVVVCHAFTGWADVESWWDGLLGPGLALDPERDFIVCSNILGSCYGTTGPTSLRGPGEGPWGADFPRITIRDMVRVQRELVSALGIRRIRTVIGGSLGGMQALEWALMYPELVQSFAVIAASGRHSAWCIAQSEAQRQAIFSDPNWRGGRYTPEAPPAAGLAAARMMATCSYRSWSSFEERFSRQPSAQRDFLVEAYLERQGRKLIERYDANTYVGLSRAMDTHDVARGRGPYAEVLRRARQPALVLSIPSDGLYPPAEQEELGQLLPRATLLTLESPHGHDAFLLEMTALNALVHNWLRTKGDPLHVPDPTNPLIA